MKEKRALVVAIVLCLFVLSVHGSETGVETQQREDASFHEERKNHDGKCGDDVTRTSNEETKCVFAQSEEKTTNSIGNPPQGAKEDEGKEEHQRCGCGDPAVHKRIGEFNLPFLDEAFLETNSFTDYEMIWNKQYSMHEGDRLPQDQLKTFFLLHIHLKMPRTFWRETSKSSWEDIFKALEKKCTLIKSIVKPHPLITKDSNESFVQYLERHISIAERDGITYSDRALCAVLYSIISPEQLEYVEEDFTSNNPMGMARKLDDNEALSLESGKCIV